MEKLQAFGKCRSNQTTPTKKASYEESQRVCGLQSVGMLAKFLSSTVEQHKPKTMWLMGSGLIVNLYSWGILGSATGHAYGSISKFLSIRGNILNNYIYIYYVGFGHLCYSICTLQVQSFIRCYTMRININIRTSTFVERNPYLFLY